MQVAESFKVSLIDIFNGSSWVQQPLPWKPRDVHSPPWVQRSRTQAGWAVDWKVERGRRLGHPAMALPLIPASATLLWLLTHCRTACKWQLVHLPGVLSYDSIFRVFGMGIAKVCLGQPLGLVPSRGQ